MKKTFALFLAAILALGLCSCGAPSVDIPEDAQNGEDTATVDTAAISANYEKAVAYLEKTIDTDGMTYSLDNEDPAYMNGNWMWDGEAPATDIPADIEIDGQVITMDKTVVSELKGLGFDVTAEETVAPGESQTITLTKGNKFFEVCTGANETDKAVKTDDEIIRRFIAINDDWRLPFTYSGLTGESELEDIIDALGVPNNSILLSADAYTTSISLEYYQETSAGSQTVMTNMSIYLLYDSATDKTTMGTINYATDIFDYTAEE